MSPQALAPSSTPQPPLEEASPRLVELPLELEVLPRSTQLEQMEQWHKESSTQLEQLEQLEEQTSALGAPRLCSVVLAGLPFW